MKGGEREELEQDEAGMIWEDGQNIAAPSTSALKRVKYAQF